MKAPLPPLLFMSLLLLAQKETPAGPGAGFALAFADEFNGPELDLTRWTPHGPAASWRPVYAPKWPRSKRRAVASLHRVAGGMVTTFRYVCPNIWAVRRSLRDSRQVVVLRARFRLLPIPFGPLPAKSMALRRMGARRQKYFSRTIGARSRRSVPSAIHSQRPTCRRVSTSSSPSEWDQGIKSPGSSTEKSASESVDGVPRQSMFLALDLSGPGSGSFDIDYIRVYQHR